MPSTPPSRRTGLPKRRFSCHTRSLEWRHDRRWGRQSAGPRVGFDPVGGGRGRRRRAGSAERGSVGGGGGEPRVAELAGGGRRGGGGATTDEAAGHGGTPGGRTVRAWVDRQGVGRLSATMTPDELARLMGEVDRRCDEMAVDARR